MEKPSYHEYLVVGRHAPTEKEPHPKIYKMKLFAKSAIQAKSRFWYFVYLLLLDSDVAGSYRARFRNIQIMSVDAIPASKCRRPQTTQFHVSIFLTFSLLNMERQTRSSSLCLTVSLEGRRSINQPFL